MYTQDTMMNQNEFEKSILGLNKALFHCFEAHDLKYEQPSPVTVTDVVGTRIAQLPNVTIAAFPVKNIVSK
jgi:hypothetical protein